ncbi:MAG: 30S ribosomal protein S9 [Alphaproteobacteria bacterium]|nr:30S ribosomal protein S9 [Alphaproteobacteria bacterium]
MSLIKVKIEESKLQVSDSPAKDHKGRTYGTGRRKSSVARVWIKSGKGAFEVNRKQINDYFKLDSLCSKILSPFTIVGSEGKFDVFCTVKGGGHSGQAGAIQLGIARALDKLDPNFRAFLSKKKMLTRDSRVVERKKYGKKKARKSTQFSKR